MGKMSNKIFSSKSGFGIGYGIGRKSQPMWVSALALNQNSGFGCTLASLGVRAEIDLGVLLSIY